MGALNRAAFWKGVLIVIGVTIVYALLISVVTKIFPGEPADDGSTHMSIVGGSLTGLLAIGFFVFTIWAGLCLGIKRYHDRDKPGVWVLIQFIPLIGPIWYFVETGCLAGTLGANTYGPDPLGARLPPPASF